MATAGYGMKFSKGYLGGSKEAPMPHETDPANAGGDAESMIHAHLTKMHEATGHGHSHIQHHEDGSHTSHHITHEGELSGPHHHGSTEELAEHMKSHLPEEENEIEHGDNEEEYE